LDGLDGEKEPVMDGIGIQKDEPIRGGECSG
jgi:hypothetical protein